MAYTIVDGFADAEDHGRLGAKSQPMGGAMDVDPFSGSALIWYGALADLVVEDHGGACDAIETCVAQAWYGVAQREIFGGGDGDDLRSGEAMELDFGEAV